MIGSELVDRAPCLSVVTAYRNGWLEDGAVFSHYVCVKVLSLPEHIAEHLEGHTIEGVSFGDRLHLKYPYDLGAETVMLTVTECNFGGYRPWFVCPEIECNRSVGRLYLTTAGMRCRICLGLVYECQRERGLARAARRMRKVVLRTNSWFQRAGCFDWEPPARPKGMHTGTYERLLERWWRDVEIQMEKYASLIERSEASTRRALYRRTAREGSRSEAFTRGSVGTGNKPILGLRSAGRRTS